MPSPHPPTQLLGRRDDELLWFRRRSTLAATAAWLTAGGWQAAMAQQRGNVVALQGDAELNGRALLRDSLIQTGDTVQTGPGASLVFVIGDAAFLVRQNTQLRVERGASLFAVNFLRLLTGAVASVWGRGSQRQIVTPTLTAGIRGTGVYTEVFPEQDYRSYFCNCYGRVALSSGLSRQDSSAMYHQSFGSAPLGAETARLSPAQAINHTDEELEYLAALIGQRTAWQMMGKKGEKDGRGMIDGQSTYTY